MSAFVETSLNLLLFSVGGVRFACDADQAAVINTYHGESADDLFWFHEEIGFGLAPVRYHSPTVVTVRIGGPRTCRVIIDSLEEIAEFSPDDIRLFPSLLEPLALQKGMWGILHHKGQMVLLVDFQLLMKKRFSLAGAEPMKHETHIAERR